MFLPVMFEIFGNSESNWIALMWVGGSLSNVQHHLQTRIFPCLIHTWQVLTRFGCSFSLSLSSSWKVWSSDEKASGWDGSICFRLDWKVEMTLVVFWGGEFSTKAVCSGKQQHRESGCSLLTEAFPRTPLDSLITEFPLFVCLYISVSSHSKRD